MTDEEVMQLMLQEHKTLFPKLDDEDHIYAIANDYLKMDAFDQVDEEAGYFCIVNGVYEFDVTRRSAKACRLVTDLRTHAVGMTRAVQSFEASLRWRRSTAEELELFELVKKLRAKILAACQATESAVAVCKHPVAENLKQMIEAQWLVLLHTEQCNELAFLCVDECQPQKFHALVETNNRRECFVFFIIAIQKKKFGEDVLGTIYDHM